MNKDEKFSPSRVEFMNIQPPERLPEKIHKIARQPIVEKSKLKQNM